MSHFIKLLCRFLGHKKGTTWEHQGENSVCTRCGVVYKSGASYYKHRSFYDASRSCGMNESIYRAVDIYTKYAKNHTTPLKKRVPLLDRLSKDWVIYDGKECFEKVEKTKEDSDPEKIQIDGDHYKDCAIQPIRFIEMNKLGFTQGNVVKRITRYRKPTGKGLKDLQKIKHEVSLLQKLVKEQEQLKTFKVNRHPMVIHPDTYIRENEIQGLEADIIRLIVVYDRNISEYKKTMESYDYGFDKPIYSPIYILGRKRTDALEEIIEKVDSLIDDWYE